MEPDPLVSGLSQAEVDARRADGRSNEVRDPTSRSVGDIVRANVLTPFNLVLGILFVIIVAVGEIKDSLFGIVLVLNTLIGIVQEVRSKRALDHLALLSAPRACVRRDGTEGEVPVHELVLDDLIVLRPGDQIAVDATVLVARGLEVDESLLTGEADPVDKDGGRGGPVRAASWPWVTAWPGHRGGRGHPRLPPGCRGQDLLAWCTPSCATA